MTKKQADRIVKEMKAYAKRETATRAKARALLSKAGIVDSKGNLRKPYDK